MTDLKNTKLNKYGQFIHEKDLTDFVKEENIAGITTNNQNGVTIDDFNTTGTGFRTIDNGDGTYSLAQKVNDVWSTIQVGGGSAVQAVKIADYVQQDVGSTQRIIASSWFAPTDHNQGNYTVTLADSGELVNTDWYDENLTYVIPASDGRPSAVVLGSAEQFESQNVNIVSVVYGADFLQAFNNLGNVGTFVTVDGTVKTSPSLTDIFAQISPSLVPGWLGKSLQYSYTEKPIDMVPAFAIIDFTGTPSTSNITFYNNYSYDDTSSVSQLLTVNLANYTVTFDTGTSLSAVGNVCPVYTRNGLFVVDTTNTGGYDFNTTNQNSGIYNIKANETSTGFKFITIDAVNKTVNIQTVTY